MAIAKRVERLWELAEEELHPDGSVERLTLRVGAGFAWRKRLLPEIVLEMQNRFPALVFDILSLDYSTAPTDLREGRFDILFMGAMDRLELSDLAVHPMITVTDRLVAREGHPIFEEIAANGKVPAISVTRYPWLEVSAAPIFGTQVQDALFGALGFRPRPMMTCENLDTSLAILQRSEYIAILPDAMTSDAGAPRILPVPLDIHTNFGLAGMIYRPEMADWPQIKELLKVSELVLTQSRAATSLFGKVTENVNTDTSHHSSINRNPPVGSSRLSRGNTCQGFRPKGI
ncbi:substrate-binding domain-containing protein [Agrobacterium sp. NPDC090283]|uniref:substrate-binding domain-containing protein n=1 Tax=Agrobacterium sp. NPDC090283 TaxID=3363920 RepID=UPI00383BA282